MVQQLTQTLAGAVEGYSGGRGLGWVGAWGFVTIEEWTDALPCAGLEFLTQALQGIVKASLAEPGCVAGCWGAFIGDLQHVAILLDQRHELAVASAAQAAGIAPAVDEMAAKAEAKAGLLVLAGQRRQQAQPVVLQQSQEHILHRILRCVGITAQAMGMQAQLRIVPQIKRADFIFAGIAAWGLRFVRWRRHRHAWMHRVLLGFSPPRCCCG